PDAGQTLSFAIVGGNTGGAFAIDSAAGKITVANSSALDPAVNPSFALVVQVTDSGSPALSATATVNITVQVTNHPPVIGAQRFHVNEGCPAGTVAGPAAARDPDAGQTLTLAIVGGNTGGAFAIDRATGKITVANAASVDYETNPTFSLSVRVTDNGIPALS